MTPSHYNLFWSLNHFLGEQAFKEDDYLKSGLLTFFNEKSSEFYRKSIYDILMCWQYIADHYGVYIVDRSYKEVK